MQVTQLLFCLGRYSIVSFSFANGKLLIEGISSDGIYSAWAFLWGAHLRFHRSFGGRQQLQDISSISVDSDTRISLCASNTQWDTQLIFQEHQKCLWMGWVPRASQCCAAWMPLKHLDRLAHGCGQGSPEQVVLAYSPRAGCKGYDEISIELAHLTWYSNS